MHEVEEQYTHTVPPHPHTQNTLALNTDGGRQRFSGKVVVITGAAGDIGGATAEAFAREGASVVLVDLPSTVSKLGERCEQLKTCGAQKTIVLGADMTKEEEVQSLVTCTVETVGKQLQLSICLPSLYYYIGPIDCFINNAGIQGQFAPVHLQDTDMFRKVVEVNVVGVFLGLKYASTAMAVSGGGGVIVNMASLAGLMGPRYMAAYAASKHAVIGLTKTAAKDLAPSGVRVCAVSPGLLEGKMWETQVEGKARCNLQTTTGIYIWCLNQKIVNFITCPRGGQASK